CADLPVVYDVLLENPDHTFSLKEPSQRILDFDASGRLTSIVSPHGQRINVVYNQESSSPAEILDEVSGKSFRLTYNGDNLLSTVTDGLGRKVSFLYNSNYLMQVILADASVTLTLTNVFLYDSRGHLASQLNPDGAYVFTNTYDAQGRVSSQVDALTNSLSACFVYDESQTNLIRTTVVDRAGGITSYLYNTNYELISFVDALGHTTSYGYDARGNKIATTNALGAVSRFLYDARGNTIESFDPLSSQTTFEYDARNNLVGLTNALEANESFAYDSSNNLVTSVDFMTNTVGLAYDDNSQLARKTSTRGGITSFSH